MMKDIAIYPDATIKEAMEALDRTAEKILLVVDKNRILLGTLSDGDLRRCILREQNLKGSIENAYNREPFSVVQDEFEKDALKIVFTNNNISVIPVLDEHGKVVDYLTWEAVFGNQKTFSDKKLNVPVVIMAGGKGTRLDPFTRVLPKPLIPVGDKPVIEHIIDNFTAYGANEFYLTLNHMAKIMRAYFDEKTTDYSIEFVMEDEPRGTAGSLKLLKDKLRAPFFVSNCDVIVEADYADLYSAHIKNSHDITLVASTKHFNIPYGICELNNRGGLDKIIEKPEYSFLVNTGLYVLNHDTLCLIPDNGLFHITHLIDEIKKNSGSIGVYPVSEKSWIDVGQWAEYRKALKVMEGI
jgi:dTDP-glucose pyrophosphorylase